MDRLSNLESEMKPKNSFIGVEQLSLVPLLKIKSYFTNSPSSPFIALTQPSNSSTHRCPTRSLMSFMDETLIPTTNSLVPFTN